MNPTQPMSYNSSYHGGRGNLLVIIALFVLLIISLIFGFTQFGKARDYKDNVDKKINQALAAKASQLQNQAQQAFDAVNTYQYKGSSTFGSVTFRYPKTWSAYVDTSSSSEPINGYFHPGIVPAIDGDTSFALRVELTDSDYSQVLDDYSSQIGDGTVKARAYMPPKMKGVANAVPGTYLTGQISNQNSDQQGNMVIVKVRDKTLQIYTEGNDYLADFKNIILASLRFAP
ncbi:MAG TPA: hypothetical protein VFW90_03745 [Candidatus Saccharimonadales bacterium]|nr:hypothetical protein [Candidatus Saccharimonadales bacterium]